MSAKQTHLRSASLVVLLAVPIGSAAADEVEPSQPVGEVQPEPTEIAPPGAVAPTPPPAPPAPPKRRPTGTFTIGAGFSTDDSFIATAGIAQNDLFGTGHRLSLDARISARQQLFRARFEDPDLWGSDYSLRAELYNDRRQFVGFGRQAAGGELTLTRHISPHLRAFAAFRVEDITVEAGSLPWQRGSSAPPVLEGGRVHALRTGVEYSTLSSQFLPRRGSSVGVALDTASALFGSEIEMRRVDAWASHHRPIGPLTLHLSGTMSSVTELDGGYNVPISERLHFDGASDVRGYAPGSLGPYDHATNMSLGGNFKYTARAELEVPLISKWGISAVGFVDHGGIYAPGAGSMGLSAGFGLIWRSPIGPLRFDWAVPVDGPEPVFGFSLGL